MQLTFDLCVFANYYWLLRLDMTLQAVHLQVSKHPLVPERAADLPTVSPQVCGRPHSHAYLAASLVVGPPNWGALQVGICPLLRVSLLSRPGELTKLSL
jgi:hypothetical protein